MTRYLISNRSSGAELGVYEGETEADALDAMARDAGYDSFAASCETIGKTVGDSRADLVIEPADIIIVNDGQYRWGADRAKLLAALERLGWERRKSGLTTRYAEPDMGEDADPAAAYTALCQTVQPTPGFDADGSFDADEYETFRFREDLGRGVWELG